MKLPGRAKPILQACPTCKSTDFNHWLVESDDVVIVTCRNCKIELGRVHRKMLW